MPDDVKLKPDSDKTDSSNKKQDQKDKNDNLESLNFIEPQYHKETLFDQIFAWTLQEGRKIIIFTEIIVLGVFVSRFALDRKIHDLRENVENKKVIIEATKDIEVEQRRIQFKLSNLNEVISMQVDFKSWLDEFTKKVPQNLGLTTLTLKPKGASLGATASDAPSFATFVNLLVNDPTVNTVILTSSKYDKETSEYKFTMDVNLKKK